MIYVILLSSAVKICYHIFYGGLMKKTINLLESNILTALTRLAVPIMASSFIQMAYNMTDMIWLGRVGSGAVTSVGTAGMYMWFANGLAVLPKMGGQVKAGYCIGAGDYDKAAEYTAAAFQLAAMLSICFGGICMLFSRPLIAFFGLTSPDVIRDARFYLIITCGLLIFSFMNQVFAGIMTARGNSISLLLATASGLVLNIVIDPVLIFGLGPFPRMGVTGAAIATVIAQIMVTLIFVRLSSKDTQIFQKKRLFRKTPVRAIKELICIGLPSAIQSIIFTSISMVLARIIAGFGEGAVAVQKIGSQIESISWMISDGFGAAVNSFIAQNYGAENHRRILKGYRAAMILATIWGIVCTLLLVVFPEPLFRFFLPEAELLGMGTEYLRVMGVSQLFMCIEITTAGAFSGLGKTMPPSLVSVVFTVARIPLALFLIATALDLNGIWWSITISSIAKGIALVSWFVLYLRSQKKFWM